MQMSPYICAHVDVDIHFNNKKCYVYLSFRLESTQLEDPRQEWKSIQEQMLREYLSSAQDVLVAKKEIYDVKNRRLRLAEDEYNMLTAMAASRSSCKQQINLLVIFLFPRFHIKKKKTYQISL